ncbi:uncharacterized protein NPIL_278661 [Nephila pilipes]|uniref:MACPF domain-containing protein n=1 Tax=Nephila pilipes TaxID=299642 RepID=A0A8X6PAL8_NEPPI|nr:uncharacterized protein NPIL_278661 [Nephila pilipes]
MIIPIIAGAILGMSIQMPDMTRKSYYIFDPKDVETNLQIIPRTFTQSQYRLIESSSEAKDLLNIDGDLALKVKNGDISMDVYGKYMKETRNRRNTMEMLVSVCHETHTETFPSYTKLRTDWQGRPQKDVGTHYIRSITYGGQLIISYQLKATKDEYMEEIKAAVTGNLAISGSLDANVTGKLEKLSEAVKDKSTVQITAYATTGVFSPPSNLEACLKLVQDYPEMVRKVNNGKGAPLKLEVVELATLQANYTKYDKNFALDAMLNEGTDKYDDLRISLQEYRAWEDSGVDWDPKYDEEVNKYQGRLKLAYQAFQGAISNLDPTKGLDQFDEAFKKYGENGENIPNRYARELLKLKHLVEEKPFFWFPYTVAVTHYIHWGSVNCTLPSPRPLYIGYAATAPISFGNGGNLECLPAYKPGIEKKQLGSTVVSEINGLKYELPNKEGGQTLCSYCKLENATVAYTISGRTTCPEQMKLEYSGYLMTSRDAGTGSSFVCLDEYPDKSIPDKKTFSDDKTALLTPVWAICPDCDEDENKKFISCVVCSR